MRLDELLNEGGLLFHGYNASKVDYAIEALKNNRMAATSTQRFWADGRRRQEKVDPDYENSFWMKGVSMTRDFDYAKRWGTIVFSLDRGKLAQRYKIIPYHWGYHMPNSNSRKREREDFVAVKRTPDTYKDVDPEYPDLPAQFNTKRFMTPEGYIDNLDSFLIGIYIDNRYADDPRYSPIINHPKFKGVFGFEDRGGGARSDLPWSKAKTL